MNSIPLFIFVRQKEVLHLLPAEVDLVLVVLIDGLRLVHGVVQGHQELLEVLHDGRGRTEVHVMDVAQPGHPRDV